jgi:hypothetical protein
MKSRIFLYLVFILTCSFLACTKESSKENGQPSGPANGDFYATVDGNPWNADSLQLILASSDGVTITGTSKTGEQIAMILPVFKTGTYVVNAQSLAYAMYTNVLSDVVSVFVSNAGTVGGTITISSIDSVHHLVSGSFHFTLNNPADNTTKTITEGVFAYVPYSGDPGGTNNHPPPSGSDTLQAKIDGNSFNAVQVEVSVSNGQLLIAGFSADLNKDIAILMPADIVPGSYDMDFATGLYIGIYNPDPTITLITQNNGTLTIISNDKVGKRIKGTFSFIASPVSSGTPANITEGYFALNY